MAAQVQPAMAAILTCGYRAKCVAPGCGNVARTILRYTDAGGRPLRQSESCNPHTTEAKDAAADGLEIRQQEKVTGYSPAIVESQKLHCSSRAD
jgi:hypothetical protein